MVAQELRGRGEDSPGNVPWNYTSVKSKMQAHTYKAIHAAWVQTQWFIYIKPMTQNRLLISTQNGPKTSNGRLWGGRERSHIKGINQRHNLGSTWVIFHLKHIAKHLVLNTPRPPPPPSLPISLLDVPPQWHRLHSGARGSGLCFTPQPDLLAWVSAVRENSKPSSTLRLVGFDQYGFCWWWWPSRSFLQMQDKNHGRAGFRGGKKVNSKRSSYALWFSAIQSILFSISSVQFAQKMLRLVMTLFIAAF